MLLMYSYAVTWSMTVRRKVSEKKVVPPYTNLMSDRAVPRKKPAVVDAGKLATKESPLPAMVIVQL